MTVDPQKTAHHAAYAGHEYHFCSAGCREKFVGDPEHYLNKSADQVVDAPPGTMWTCPMHPQIRQDHPGVCPIRSEEHTSETQSLMRITYADSCVNKNNYSNHKDNHTKQEHTLQ